MKSITFLGLSMLFWGCSTIPRGYKLSKFSYNGKIHNDIIVNRIPDYGDGHLDGCVIMSEMSLSLKSLENGKISGELKDVKSLESLSNGQLKIFFKNIGSPLILASDSSGKFQFDRKAKVEKISVFYVGYRGLTVDLSNTKQL